MEKQWLEKELSLLLTQSNDYKQKALLVATLDLVKEQAFRQEKMEGELDGTLWSPRQWR
ncbi:hypothetical protein [Vagococcus intermedius]|uniref:Uncharacterized protein n=1 Tax=Vagococcus intermedius TaxID=2991418 RepID=A0AAF0I8Z2_9ENTE|nr:hypothetical protein [Vagococcus intermedius]WEG72992.1 hypothetical protein OL234_08435 [Vagococcus intermedius]WEG75078.1 hypothetical protein OL235_08430 [Vagococcus intermedius]